MHYKPMYKSDYSEFVGGVALGAVAAIAGIYIGSRLFKQTGDSLECRTRNK